MIDFTIIGSDDLVSSLRMEELIEINSLEQHKKNSNEVGTSIVLKVTIFDLVLKDKEPKVPKPPTEPLVQK